MSSWTAMESYKSVADTIQWCRNAVVKKTNMWLHTVLFFSNYYSSFMFQFKMLIQNPCKKKVFFSFNTFCTHRVFSRKQHTALYHLVQWVSGTAKEFTSQICNDDLSWKDSQRKKSGLKKERKYFETHFKDNEQKVI